MQMVSLGDKLHGVSILFSMKNKKYFKMSSAQIFTRHAKYLEASHSTQGFILSW